MALSSPEQPTRIVVELVASADVKRLEEADQRVLGEVQALGKRIDALQRMYFECLDIVRDQRKKWGFPIAYLLVPEQHKDGCWHMHGLLNLPAAAVVSFAELRANGVHVPDKLVDGGYCNWSDFQRKFGYCSLGALKSPVGCAFYIQKYISKELDTNGVAVGKRLLLHSNGLNRAVKHGDIYGGSSYLDSFLTNHYEFCSTGMTKVADGLDWTFAMDRMDLQPFDTDYGEDELPDVEQLIEVLEQLSFMERMNI